MDEVEELQDEVERLEGELAEKEDEIGSLEAKIDDLESDNYQLEQDVEIAEDSEQETSRILDETTEELTQYENIKDLVQELSLERGQIYADLLFYQEEYSTEEERLAYGNGFKDAVEFIVNKLP